MKRFPALWRSLYDLRWQVFWYGFGLGLYAAIMVWSFPTFEGLLQQIEVPEEFLRFFGGESAEFARPSGYLGTRYQGMAPIVLVIYAIVASTALLAGEEGRGSLESVLAQPISRTRLALEKMAAFLLGAAGICLLICLGWLASVPFIDLHGDVTLAELVAATFAVLPVVALFGALGFFVAAIAPSRGIAAGLLTALAVGTYLLASFARTITTLEWLQYASPFYYAHAERVLIEGIFWRDTVALAVAALLMGLLAVLAFRGREIGVHTWQPLAWLPPRI